jgi:hypothetical protein
LALAAILVFGLPAPAEADGSADVRQGVTATWGTPVIHNGWTSYNPLIQFWAGRRAGPPDYLGDVGVGYTVGFGSTRSYCDEATDEMVTIGLYGPPPAGWARLDRVAWTFSRSGARVEAVLDLYRFTSRRPDCSWPGQATSITESLGPATLIAEFDVIGPWERRELCTRYATPEPAMFDHTTGWWTNLVAASLTVSGSVELDLGPATQQQASLSRSQSAMVPADKGQPWECVPG